MVDTKEKVLFEGLTVCWYCGRAVKGKLVVREKLTYVQMDCSIDGKYETLVARGNPVYENLISQHFPAIWPRWEPQVGTQWNDRNIINRKNIPVLVFTVTTKCNSSCKICLFPKIDTTSHVLLDADFMKEKLSFYKGKEIILCGGEPTTREDLPELIKIIKESGNTPVIQTNGLRLANREYVRQLKEMGIKHVHLSFDGFKEEIYERVRGGKYEYNLKLAALDNLTKENMKISLKAVIIKAINEDQISEIISYAVKTRNIIEIVFLNLYLVPPAIEHGFKPEDIIQPEQIKRAVARFCAISPEEFLLWDEFKINLAFYLERLKSILTFLPVPVFHKGMVYLKRRQNSISPLLNKDELNRLNFALKNNKIKDLFTILGVKSVKMLLKNCFIPGLTEDLFFYRENMFKIVVIDPLSSWFSPFLLTTFGYHNVNIKLFNKIHQG